jgi:photosystem II stability/assembly factor-like uncharacterized protein
MHLHAIARVAGDVWIAGEQGLLLRLDADGGRFRAIPVPYAGSFFGVTGTGQTVVVFGLRGNAFRSRDRGATWQRVETGTAESITGAALTRDGRIVLVTEGGEVRVSADEGRCFRLAARGPPAASVAAGPAGIVIAGGGGLRVETLP